MDRKTEIERQFEELIEKAREVYPDIDKSMATMDNIIAQTMDVRDYLNLSDHEPSLTSNNQIAFS